MTLEAALLDATPVMMYVYDRDGIFRSANRATHEAVGQPPGALVGRSLKSFLTTDSAGSFEGRLQQLEATGMLEEDVSIVAADGATHILRIRNRILDLAGEQYFLGTAIDVSLERRLEASLVASEARLAKELDERRLADAEIQRLNADLERRVRERTLDLEAANEALRRAETLSAVGELIAGVAHEVRNPLFAISANLDCIEMESGDVPQLGEFVGHLRRETQRLERVMRELLDYARPSSAESARLPIREVLSGAVEDCRALARERRVRLELESADGDAMLAADVDRLRQAFRNLIENALHFAPRESLVRIAARRTPTSRGDTIEVSVADRGKGFAPEELPRIFDPFYSKRRGGTGLGLAIAKRIVDEHCGSIRAGNLPSGGAIVTVALPALDTVGEPSSPEPARS